MGRGTSPAPKNSQSHGAAVPSISTGVSFGKGVVIAMGALVASITIAELGRGWCQYHQPEPKAASQGLR